MTAREIDTLRDVAVSLERDAPFEAYILFRTAFAHRPGGPLLRQKVDALGARTRPNTIVAWRNDGLCERINAIVLGYFAARLCGLEFRFFWPDLSYLSEQYDITFGAGHSVPDSAAEILAPRFVEEFEISVGDLLEPRGGFRDGNPVIRPFILDDLAKLDRAEAITRPCWLAPWRALPEITDAFPPAGFAAFFRHGLFGAEIKAQFDAIEALGLPTKRVALHVRAGDVIYDGARHTHTFGRIKTVSLAVAEALRDHYVGQGFQVILFGATASDLALISEDHEGVTAASVLGLDPVDLPTDVVRDVWLMAGGAQIVTAEDTGVTKLAELVGEAELVAYTRVLPPAEEYRVSVACVQSGRLADYPVLQRAFVYYGMFITAPDDVAIDDLVGHAREALEADPDNVQYMVLCRLGALATGHADLADTYEARIAAKVSGGSQAIFEQIPLRMRYLRARERNVQRLLALIDARGADAPGLGALPREADPV